MGVSSCSIRNDREYPGEGSVALVWVAQGVKPPNYGGGMPPGSRQISTYKMYYVNYNRGNSVENSVFHLSTTVLSVIPT